MNLINNTFLVLYDFSLLFYVKLNKTTLGFYVLLSAGLLLPHSVAGMRSFPGNEDNIDHEILIATDGCRTSNGYYLDQGLKTIKKRGIKVC